ncbi:MAG: DUF1178 family protein [Deltaproteobacteria bacterium]|nr:DUF1178 family protein [Deltaproteobacteria bacterium]
MISFDLECENGHFFEGWFQDADAFDKQQKDGLLSCPVCNSSCVYKLPSAFAIKKAGSERKAPASLSALKKKMQDTSKVLNEFLEKNFKNVGTDFTKEALNIHYGLKEPKNIRGVSTKKEEKLLAEEGVKFIKFPRLSSENTDKEQD